MRKLRGAGILFLVCLLLFSAGLAEGRVEALYERTTAHSGLDSTRSVSQEDLGQIVDAAFSMPTGGGQSSLCLYVVTDREILQSLRQGNPYSQGLETAPLAIVLVADESESYYPELEQMDAGLAAGGMLVQASALGITTCVLSIYPQEQRVTGVRDALDLHEDQLPILMIAMGYPEADTRTGASVDRSQNGRVFFVSAEQE